MRLPWGSTTQIAHSTTVRGTANELLAGTRYILPDGKSCLVLTSNPREILNSETEVAFSYEFNQKDGTWTRAFVPYLKGDTAKLAQEMLNQTSVQYRYWYGTPPSSDALLPLLPPGTTVTPIDETDYRDGRGRPLKSLSYHLPGGKTCTVVKASDF